MPLLAPTDSLARQWPVLVYAMLARLALVFLLLILAWAMASPAPGSGFYAFVCLVFIISIPYALWLREDRTIQASALYQFAVDAVIITGLVHFTGGVNSHLSLLYPLIILTAGIVVNGRLALKVAILSVFLYATLVTLEMSGAIVYRGSAEFPYSEPAQVLQMLMLRVLIFVLFAAASSFLADKCFYQGRQLEHFRVVATAILDSVAVPLMAVYSDGRILMVNPAAAQILGESAQQAKKKSFNDYFPESVPSLDDPGDASQIWTMRRADGTQFPVTYHASKGNFPAAVLGSLVDDSNGVNLYVVAIQDMAALLSRESDQDGTRQEAAVGMIAEMAHVVRNPLTAIRGAGEILNSAVDAMFNNANSMTEQDWGAVKSMSELIYQETKQLDEKVEYFLQCAVDNPGRLKEMIADAETWRAKIIARGGPAHGQNTSG